MADPMQQSTTPQIDPASGMTSIPEAPEPQAQATAQAPAPPSPPGGDSVQWDPTPDTTDLLAQATKLGGPLGGIAVGSLQGAHAHENQGTDDQVQWDAKPDVSSLSAPVKVRYSVPGQGIRDFIKGTPEEKEFLEEHPQAAPRPYPTGEAYMAQQDQIAKSSRAKAGKALAVGGGALATVLTAGAAAPLLEGALGTGALAGIGEGAITGGLSAGAGAVARQGLSGENPLNEENIGETAKETALGAGLGGLFGIGGKLLSPVAQRVKDEFNLRFLQDGTVTEQGVKDGIAAAINNKKADATMINDAYALLENQKPRPYSDFANELKLVKPKLDDRIAQNNAMIDAILDTGPQPPVKNAAAQLTRFFDDMANSAGSSMSRTGQREAQAIQEVRDAVIPKLTDEMSAQEVNNVRKEMDAHIKSWDPTLPLDGAAKQAQEAYRMARFKMADLVKGAQKETAPLFDRWHNDINLNELLEQKFNTLSTPQQFRDSYQAYRKAAQSERAKALGKTIVGKGMMMVGLGAGYHALNPFGH